MKGPVAVRCPAKINPQLRVLGRRPDGFHELDLTFVSLALSDRLDLTAAEGFALEVVGERAAEVEGADNLVVRAARLLQDVVGRERLPGARLRLGKVIPTAAGLGGGSSDAAGALEGLVRLHSLDVAPEALADVALELGSDVPYFLAGGHRRGRGRGERLELLPDLPELPLLLVRPRRPLSTRAVFERHSRGEAAVLTNRKIQNNFNQEPRSGEGEVPLHNDLWPAALAIEPELGDLRARLEEAWPAACVGLSGSGPTLFALGRSPADAEPLGRLADSVGGADVDTLLTWTLGHAAYRATRFAPTSGPVGGEDRGG